MAPPRTLVAVRLLGGPQLAAGPEVRSFGADKRHQLLAYLAYFGHWVSRDELADLFWPGTTTQLAKQNLRRLLGRTRELTYLQGLEVERPRLRWQVDTDVARFKSAVDAERWDEALDLYQGPLLSGLESYDDSGFASWLALEREHWHTVWRDIALQRARQLAGDRRYDRAAVLLHRALDQDGLDEDALVAYLEVAEQAGQGRQALRVFEQFKGRLWRELGLEPTATARLLAERLAGQGATAVAAPAPDAAPVAAALPSPGTSFVGRELEIAEIANLLGKAACQLLVLVGPGGVGKTRIAIEAATELAPQYAGGAVFVPAEGVPGPSGLFEAIAAALKLPLQEREDRLTQVARFVGEKRLLLVLDNFEHLLAAALAVRDLVRRCPQLQVLVTSRERVDLPEAWTLRIEGLAYPSEPGTPGDVQAYDAIALFVERAQRVHPIFVLTRQELPAVLDICRLVQGFPLGIELAAVWVRVMSCAEIVRELQADLDFLASSSPGVDERHASIRAAFEHSWALLSPREQASLRRLGVFRGGFDKEAAGVVAGTSIALLAALADKSLLRVAAPSRFEIHALVRQFAREKLSEDAAQESKVLAEHAAYFVALGERAETQLKGAQREHWMRRLDQDYENLRAALDRTHAQEAEAEVRLAGSLWRFWWLKGRYREGRSYLERALAHPGARARSAVRAKALGGLGVLAWGESEYAAAQAAFEESLSIRRRLGDELGVLDMLNNLGILAHERGRFERARSLYEAVLEMDDRLGERQGAANVLGNLGSLALDQDDVDTAHRYFEQSLALCRELADSWGVASRLIGLGGVELRRGNDVRALGHYEEAVAIARTLGDKAGIGFGLRGLGRIALGRGELDAAQAAFEESLVLARETGDRRATGYSVQGAGLVALERGRHGEAQALLEQALALQRGLEDTQGAASSLHALGRIALERGDVDLAERHFLAGIRLGGGPERSPGVAPLLEGLAEAATARGEPERAIRLLAAAASWRAEKGSPATAGEQRRQQATLTRAREQLPEAAAERAWAAGRWLTLEQAVEHASLPVR